MNGRGTRVKRIDILHILVSQMEYPNKVTKFIVITEILRIVLRIVYHRWVIYNDKKSGLVRMVFILDYLIKGWITKKVWVYSSVFEVTKGTRIIESLFQSIVRSPNRSFGSFSLSWRKGGLICSSVGILREKGVTSWSL